MELDKGHAACSESKDVERERRSLGTRVSGGSGAEGRVASAMSAT
jgi:hypothetical protein